MHVKACAPVSIDFLYFTTVSLLLLAFGVLLQLLSLDGVDTLGDVLLTTL